MSGDQPDSETQGTGSTCSSVYASEFAEGRVCGIQGAGGIQGKGVGALATKDAIRWRIKRRTSVACFGTLCLARLLGPTG